MKAKRTFTKDEKLQLLKEVEQNGLKDTLEKHGIYPATYYSWRRKYEQMGEMGFLHGMTPAHIKRIKQLEKENEVLKKLLAEKELEGHLKDEMLKKKYAWARKNL